MRFLLFFFLASSCVLFSATLEQKIGQMVLIGFRGTYLEEDSPLLEEIRRGELGGVLLFDWDRESNRFGRNITSPQQLRHLTRQLQLAAPHTLLIAIDQEGGFASRLKEEYGFPPTLSATILGKRNDLSRTKEEAERTATTLRDLGINVNLAPVVDIGSPGGVIGKKERSFSEDPLVVVAHAREVVAAHQSQKILTALKHFPGIGSACGDTHAGFVDVGSVWCDSELFPFITLIEEGKADMIMVGHTWNEALDSARPASLSRKVVRNLLRKQLKYEGLVISDDYQMGAIREHYALEEIVSSALAADVDLMLFANQEMYDEEIGRRVIAIVKELIAGGEISRSRIDASYRRIRKAQEKLFLGKACKDGA